jgi:putative ABC transport system ATP-binding protein
LRDGKDVVMTNWFRWLRSAFSSARKTASTPTEVVRRAPSTRRFTYVGGRRKNTTLKARNLRHTFGQGEARTAALRGVSLELFRGELTLFMGPSGSGKSTLLSTISGLMRPDQGKVMALGADYWGLSRREQDLFRLRHFGHVPQNLDLIPALTARQQIEMMLRWGEGAGAKEAGRRTDAVLERLGLATKANQRPDQLSGGEKQRVAIGRAIVKEPAFVFADEPTSALDKKAGLQVVELLRQHAHAHAASIVVVTHDPHLIPHADRVFYMADGQFVAGEADHERVAPPRRRSRAAG